MMAQVTHYFHFIKITKRETKQRRSSTTYVLAYLEKVLTYRKYVIGIFIPKLMKVTLVFISLLMKMERVHRWTEQWQWEWEGERFERERERGVDFDF